MPVFRRRFRSALLAGTALTLAAIVTPKIGHAATITYDGTNAPGATTSTGVFNLGSNYDAGTAPGAGDTANFDQSLNVTPKVDAITFSSASTIVGGLTFTASTNYSFSLTAGQTFSTGSLSNSTSSTETFTTTGAGAGITIGTLTNSSTGGETFASTTGSTGVSFTGAVAIGTTTLTFTGVAPTLASSFTSTSGGVLNIAGVTSGTSTVGSISDTSGGAEGIVLGANTLSVGSLAATTTYDGVISGAGGGLTLTGGTLTLSGVNTYTGATTINGATLKAGIANTIAASSSVSLNATGAFNLNGFNETLNNLSGVTGSTITLGANNLTLGGGGSDTFSGVISGTGSLIMNGTGTETLAGTNTFSGTTTFDSGILSISSHANLSNSNNTLIFNGGTLQSTATITPFTGPVSLNANGGTFDTENTSSMQVSGLVSGAGGLTKIGNGTLTLSDTNTYSGGTTVSAGTVALGATNAVSTGSLTVASGGTVTMGGFSQTTTSLNGGGTITSTGGELTADAGLYSGLITSTGMLDKETTGALVMDGTSTFATTQVSNGTLQIGDINNPTATLTSPVTVTSSGTLSGHGTVIGNVANSGVVSPGGTIGTLSVNGTYQQAPTATLAIELNPITSSLLAVSGSAGLNNGKLSVLPDAGTYTTGTRYTILTAGGGVGSQFGTVTDSSTIVYFAEIYQPNDVVLTAVNIGQPFAGETPNERNVSGAISSLVHSSPNSAFIEGLINFQGAVIVGSTTPQVASALGELRADIATIDLANASSFQNLLVERMDQRQGLTTTHSANNGLPGTFDVAMNDTDLPLFGPSGVITNDQPSVWMHGYGVLGEGGGDSGYADYQARTGGIVAGTDVRATPGTLIGGAVAYEHTDFNLGGDTDGNAIDTYRVSLYGSQKLDPVPLVLDAAVGYAFNDYHDSSVLPLITGTGYTQTSRHDGNELTAETGLSHSFAVPQNLTSGSLTLVPRVGVEYDNIQQNAYATTGSPIPGLDLATNGSTLNALRSTIGGKADLKLVTSNGTVVTPEVRAAYLHDFIDTNVALTENFTGAPGAGFQVSGVRPGRDGALVGTGVTVGFSQNISATLSYDADVREHELDNTVQAGVKYTW